MRPKWMISESIRRRGSSWARCRTRATGIRRRSSRRCAPARLQITLNFLLWGSLLVFVYGMLVVPLRETLSGAQRIPALTSSMAAMIPGVSQPEIQRQVRQQRADIDALYELVERVDQKVDALDIKLDRRFDEISGQLSEVLRQLGGR